MSSTKSRDDDYLPHYRQSNGYHFCILLSLSLCGGLLAFFLYSLCINNLSFIFISFVALLHALIIWSFAIYQYRKCVILEMMNEDKDSGFSLNTVSRDDVYDSDTLWITKYQICSCILQIAEFIDYHSINAIDSEQRAQRLRSAETNYHNI